MDGVSEPGNGEALGRRDDLPEILAMVRALIRELAKRKLSPLLASREDASDLAQSVVLEMIENGSNLQFRGTASTQALAREILVRLISTKVRALRTQKRDHGKELRLPDDIGEWPPAESVRALAAADPATLAEIRELLALNESRLLQLSQREQQVVRRRVAGETHLEIGAALGISEALSQRLLSDARRKLRSA